MRTAATAHVAHRHQRQGFGARALIHHRVDHIIGAQTDTPFAQAASAKGAPRIKLRRFNKLAVCQREKDQNRDRDQRPFGDHADKAVKGFFLNTCIHFTMLVLCHIVILFKDVLPSNRIDDSRGHVTCPCSRYVAASSRSSSWASRNPIRFGSA